MNTRDDGKEDDAATKGSKSGKIAVFRFPYWRSVEAKSVSTIRRFTPKSMNCPTGIQIVLRMNFWHFRPGFWAKPPNSNVSIPPRQPSKQQYLSSRSGSDALGEYLQKTIVEVDLKRARISAQEYRTSLIAQQRNRIERASAGVHARRTADDHGKEECPPP